MFKQLVAADHCRKMNLFLVCVKVMIVIFIESTVKGVTSLRKTE